MWDWDTVTKIATMISATVALIQAVIFIAKAKIPLPKMGPLVVKIWGWIALLAVLVLIGGGSAWIYQQVNPNGETAEAAATAHRNDTSITTDNSDNPTPPKVRAVDQQPNPTQTPKPTPASTSKLIHTPTPDPTATPTSMLDPTETPAPTLGPTATTTPIPMSPPAPTLALAPTIRPDEAILSVVIDRNPRLTKPLDVQALSTLVTGVDGLSVEIHNAVCNNTEHINTNEWAHLRCGYYEETQEQSVIEHIIAWHESVGYLRCETDGIPNSYTMEFRCFAE